jgi:hypothetical protein
MAIIRSSSMAFLLDPRDFQEFALIGLDPGVDLLLIILLLGLGSDAEYDRTLRLVSCVVGFGGIITVTYSLDIGAGMRSL